QHGRKKRNDIIVWNRAEYEICPLLSDDFGKRQYCTAESSCIKLYKFDIIIDILLVASVIIECDEDWRELFPINIIYDIEQCSCRFAAAHLVNEEQYYFLFHDIQPFH